MDSGGGRRGMLGDVALLGRSQLEMLVSSGWMEEHL